MKKRRNEKKEKIISQKTADILFFIRHSGTYKQSPQLKQQLRHRKFGRKSNCAKNGIEYKYG
jgi:hypothetical protein